MEKYRCPNCNTEVEEGEKICPKCGTQLYKTMNTSTVVILFIILGVLIFGFCRNFISCNEKPENISKGVYNIGVSSLECIDKYIDGDETLNDTILEFAEYTADMKNRYDKKNNDELAVYLAMCDIVDCLTELNESKTFDSVINARNDLAETLNKPLYKK